MRRIKVPWENLLTLVSFPFLCVFDPGLAKAILERWERAYPGSFPNRMVLSAKIQLSKQRGSRLKINIGCGDGWSHAGWIGVDYRGAAPYPSKEGKKGFDINWDVRRGLPFGDGTVRLIFASHVLEHFTYLESERFLKECYRVLETSGCIRIVVPDLDLYISKFVSRDTEFFNEFYIAGGEWLGNITDTFLMNFYSAPVFNNTCHKYAYNFENLNCRLKQSGFREIRKSDHMNSVVAEFNDKAFDSPNSKGPLFSLYADAIK